MRLNYGDRVHNQLAYIPSPTESVLHLGPLPIHYYALCIVVGIMAALYLTDRRWLARGGAPNQVGDVAGWAVVFGILGGRIYHVITDPELYFEHGRHPLDAFKIWDGGLGIWGAIALGALGGYIGCRRHQMNFAAFADCIGPTLLVAQAIGRLGNWFNNELYGRPTSLPWKLQIHDLDVVTGHVTRDSAGHAIVLGYFQPTFLYEMIWNLAIAAVLLWADRRFRIGRGNVFAGYVAGYTFGRFWIELLRSDHANRILGLRINDWTSILLFVAALIWIYRHRSTPRTSAAPDSGARDVDVEPGGAGLPDGGLPAGGLPDGGLPDPAGVADAAAD